MAFMFDNDSPGIAQTHALVIGVGGYRHLAGGSEEKGEIIQQIGLLEQLTSPPQSALAFANMLVELAGKWREPLGTVDLLISRSPGDSSTLPAGVVQETPTITAIRQAYAAWRARCDRHTGNIAIFYFCGHGFEKEEQILLAEDFGATTNYPWAESFAFDSTRLAFQSCIARTQCFFIDACRQITSSMLTHLTRAQPLDNPDLTAPELAANLTIQGTARTQASLGPPGDVAYFSQALIRALKGAAAESPGNNRWEVKSNSVAAKIQEIMGMVNPDESYAQRAASRTSGNALLLQVDPPQVELFLACQPDDANEEVELTCSRLDPPGFTPAQHAGAPWLLKVDPGFYVAEAHFREGNFRDANTRVWASPPRQSPPLECHP